MDSGPPPQGFGRESFDGPRFGDSGVPAVAPGSGRGRQVLATGGNRLAAEFSGVSTGQITFTVMPMMSLVSAIAGILYAGRIELGGYQRGAGSDFRAIVGGASAMGTVIGLLFGSLLIGVIVAVALARKK